MTSVDPSPEDRFNPYYIPEGTSIGKYVVRTGIGRGGGQMAYLAHDPNGNLVVLKVALCPRGESGTRDRMMHERFIRQVQYFLQLRDVPAVASVLEHGMHPDNSEHGYPYLVQEWVWGGTNFVDWYRATPRPLEFVVRGWMYLASACGAMEQRGIRHRDLKPGNILMMPHGLPKIVDFDSGMSVGAATLTGAVPGGWFPGTRSYFSPELCKAILMEWDSPGQGQIFTYRPTADLHALGVIFYQVLTGEHPFDENAGDEELLWQIASEVPRLPRTLNPDVPFALEKMTMKLLRKDPEKRYQTGDELAHDLEALLETPEDWNRPFQTPAGKGRSTSATSSRVQTSRTHPGAPPHAPEPPADSSVEALEKKAGPRAASGLFQRFGRRFWKQVAMSGGSAVVLAILLVPFMYSFARSSADKVIVIAGSDGSHVPFEPEDLLAMSEWGEKIPEDRPIPTFLLPGQKAPPCGSRPRQEAINAGCWQWVGGSPPCHPYFRRGDKCYAPIAADTKKPAEPGPDR